MTDVKKAYDDWTDHYTSQVKHSPLSGDAQADLASQVLLDMDKSRNSWTEEDPGHEINSDVGSILPKIKDILTIGKGGVMKFPA
jgi:hypothetical protein